MIDLYTFDTSNGQRAAIALEECGLPYRTHRVDLAKGEQHAAPFLAVNPAGAIPAIFDPAGPDGKPLTLAQSGAIAIYAAEKSGRFLPRDPARRALALQWLMFAVTDCAAGSAMLYYESALLPDKSPANLAFCEQRLLRLFRVADARLADREWLADELSIADFALYPICAVRRKLVDAAGDLRHLARWMAALAARPGVVRGMEQRA
jgi:GSH-dependent disulfide-bond oxidoreductase